MKHNCLSLEVLPNAFDLFQAARSREGEDEVEGSTMEVPATQDQPRSTTKKVDERTCGSIGTERRRRSGPAVEMPLAHGRNIRAQRVEWKIGERGREMKLEREPPVTLIGGAQTMEPRRQGTNGVRSTTVVHGVSRFNFGSSFSSEHKLARR